MPTASFKQVFYWLIRSAPCQLTIQKAKILQLLKCSKSFKRQQIMYHLRQKDVQWLDKRKTFGGSISGPQKITKKLRMKHICMCAGERLVRERD